MQSIVIAFLKKKNKRSNLNFKGLIKFIEDNKFPIKDIGMNGPLGIAFHDKILLDLINLNYEEDDMLFYIILHEIAHYLRLQKLGENHILDLYIGDDLKAFLDDVIREEQFADRFANLQYYRLNKQILNQYQFRGSKEYKILPYKAHIKRLFDMVNSEEDYDALFERLTFERDEKYLEKVT